jgi:hypothetical protein
MHLLIQSLGMVEKSPWNSLEVQFRPSLISKTYHGSKGEH